MTDAMDLAEPIAEPDQERTESASAGTVTASLPDAPGDTLANAKALVSDLAERAKTDKGAPFEPDVLSALAILRQGDQAAYQRIRDDLKKAGVSRRDLDREVLKQNLRVINGGADDRGLTERAGPYRVISGALCHEKRTPDGPVTMPLCNFNVRIVGEEIRDDGAERITIFSIEGLLQDGKPLPKADVPAERYSGMNWVTSNWGTAPVIFAGQGARDHLRVAIQLLSGQVPRRTVFGHLGWRHLNGEWKYLHGSGAIGPVGPQMEVQVQTSDSRLSLYALPEPPAGEELNTAIRASLSVLDLGPDRITLPLLSTVYRAPLGEVAVLDLTLFLAGPTGSQKTELTAIAQAHYGAGFNGKSLPGNWATTANSLEKQAFLAKDALFTVDDFAPAGTTSDVQRLHRDADRLIRGQGNRAGRGRMRPDGTMRPEYYPRGIVVSSGEDIPRGQSLRARALILEISKDQVDLARLTRAQAAASQGQLAQTMAGYVRWLAPQIDTLKQTMPERLRALRAEARKAPVHHDRTPDIVASLAGGWEMFLRFACEAGAIDDGQRMDLWQRGWQILLEAAEAQAGYQTDEEPTARFLALLGSAITSGQVHVADAETGGQPEDAGNWGWRCRAYFSGQVEQEEWQPKGTLVGWLDGDDLLLDPEAAFAAVQRLARDQGSGVLIGAKTLWKRMAEQGKLGSRDDVRGRNMVRRMIHGRRRAVIHIFSDGPLSPRTGPIGPTGPDPSVSAASGAENMGRLFGDGEKPAHETGPKPQENRDAGPIGPVGPQMGHKLRPSDKSLPERASPGDRPEAPTPAPGKWSERI